MLIQHSFETGPARRVHPLGKKASRHPLLLLLLIVLGSTVATTVCQLVQTALSYRTLEDGCRPLHEECVGITVLSTQSQVYSSQ